MSTAIDRQGGRWELDQMSISDEDDPEQVRMEAASQLPQLNVTGSAFSTLYTGFDGTRTTARWTWRPTGQAWREPTGHIPSRKFYDFVVISNGPSPMGQKVLMDGVLLKGVTKVVADIDVNAANRITITFLANSINKEEG